MVRRMRHLLMLRPREVDCFWAKIDRRGADDCWNWKACVRPTRGGYGNFRAGGVNWYPHRLAWMLANGHDCPGVVMHRCDNVLCCNPAHLEHGTQKENLVDMESKGRAGWQRADRREIYYERARSRERATPEVVAAIKQDSEAGMSMVELSAKYGLSAQTCWKARRRADVSERRITAEVAEVVRVAIEAGIPITTLARVCGVTHAAISHIKYGRSHRIRRTARGGLEEAPTHTPRRRPRPIHTKLA